MKSQILLTQFGRDGTLNKLERGGNMEKRHFRLVRLGDRIQLIFDDVCSAGTLEHDSRTWGPGRHGRWTFIPHSGARFTSDELTEIASLLESAKEVSSP